RGAPEPRRGDLRRTPGARGRRVRAVHGARAGGRRGGRQGPLRDRVGGLGRVTTSRSYQATDSVRDQRIERLGPLLAPMHLLDEMPLTDANLQTVLDGRAAVHGIVSGEDDRLLVVVGPCSVHDPGATIEYARRLSERASKLSDDLYVVMRVYFE